MHLPPDWGTFGALIVSFLAFWFIFRRLFFDPFLKLIGERERRLREFGQRTEHLIEEGKEADAQRERELAALRREALARRDAERRKAEEEAAHVIEQAKTEARASMERAREAIEREVASAESRLDAFARALADDLAERVLGRPLQASAKKQ